MYPFAVIVKPDARMQSMSDLIAIAKKSPGKLNYGSVGVGSVLHLALYSSIIKWMERCQKLPGWPER